MLHGTGRWVRCGRPRLRVRIVRRTGAMARDRCRVATGPVPGVGRGVLLWHEAPCPPNGRSIAVRDKPLLLRLKQHAGFREVKSRSNSPATGRRTGSADQPTSGDLAHEQHRRCERLVHAWRRRNVACLAKPRWLGDLGLRRRMQSGAVRRSSRLGTVIRNGYQRPRDGRAAHPRGEGAAGMDRIGGEGRQGTRWSRLFDRGCGRHRLAARNRLRMPPAPRGQIGRPPRQRHRQEPMRPRILRLWFGLAMWGRLCRHDRSRYEVTVWNRTHHREAEDEPRRLVQRAGA